jgi:hypothetical protein
MRSAKAVRAALSPLCNELRGYRRASSALRDVAIDLEDAHYTLSNAPPVRLRRWT